MELWLAKQKTDVYKLIVDHIKYATEHIDIALTWVKITQTLLL